MKIAAIYSRVSLRLRSGQASDQQKEEKTQACQTAALIEFARQENYQVPDEWVFEDEGYSGANLIRPGLERIRDLDAEGQIQSVLALYRYIRKTDESAAYYEIIESEADVVRKIFNLYAVEGLSIGAIARQLTESGVPTRKQKPRWERSVIWAILRNPAYQGRACFGKTAITARQRITRPLRLRGGISTRNSSNIELPHTEWIEIPDPALVSEETFALAQEKLIYNKLHGPRRTIEPSILQGLVHCRQCSYALYRNSSRTSARKIYYYRCTGSDAYRHGGKALCDEKPIRQDLLDQLVWNEILHLLESPTLIQNELNRRLEAARDSSPTKRRLETLNRDIIRIRKSRERLLTAYQEELLSIDELRIRMPPLRQREQAMQAELQAITHQTADRAAYLRLAETLTAFLERLRSNADTLDIGQRQKIMRLLVKEVIVGKDLITIKHSIPGQAAPTGGNPQAGKSPTQHNTTQIDKSYPLCKGRVDTHEVCYFKPKIPIK